MTVRPAVALWLYAGLALGGLAGGLLLARPELVAAAAVPAAVLVAGLAGTRRPELRVTADVPPARLIEGEPVDVTLTVTSSVTGDVLVALDVPAGLEVTGGSARHGLRLPAGEPQAVTIPLRVRRWGVYKLGGGTVRALGPAGLVAFEERVPPGHLLWVFPAAERLRSLVAPLRTQPAAGQQRSREAGEGIEFAELQALGPADSPRSVNWRASARRQAIVVNRRHPERKADVVCFLDTFAGDAEGLDRPVRAAAAVAAAVLRRRDRIGMIGFGGVLSWLRPGAGVRHWYRVVELLLRSRVVHSEAWKGVGVLPLRALPAQALVLAVTPLADERSVAALLDLCGRGFDVAVVEVPPRALPPRPDDRERALAWRVWTMEREALRHRFAAMGVAVVTWEPGVPLDVAIGEVIAFRHAAQRAGA